MRIAIDMDGMRITHAHPVAEILEGLTYLEATSVHNLRFESTERPGFLEYMTTLELTMLYANMTGHKLSAQHDDLTRRELVLQYAESITPRVVDMAELERQIASVDDQLIKRDSPSFRYVLGSNKPRIDDGGLFPLAAPHKLITNAAIEEAAQRAPQHLSTRAAATPLAAPAPRPAPAQRVARAAGSVSPVVWRVADEVWAGAGSPKDLKTVLALRKKMGDILETEHGVKRNSSSNILGAWQKDRLA